MKRLFGFFSAAFVAVFVSLSLFSCGHEDPVPATVGVSGVSINKTTLSLTEGGSETLTATVAPDNATNKVVTWSTSDNNIANVSDGKVTAVKAVRLL